MQLGLVALTMIILSSMGHSDVLKLSKARRQRRGEFPLFHSTMFVSSFSSSSFLTLKQSCYSFLKSDSLWWTSCKHLTSKVKITFCLFPPSSLFVFHCGLCWVQSFLGMAHLSRSSRITPPSVYVQLFMGIRVV